MDFEKFIEKYKMQYKIVCLRHQQEKSYKEIADQLNLSVPCIKQKYQKFLQVLYKFYIQYLQSNQVKIDKWEIHDFYVSNYLSIAYLEKTYKEYLDSLRGGMPPIIFEEHMYIPPFRNLTEEKVLELEKYILEAKEQQKRTFIDIGKEIELSRDKTKRIYDHYYHKKVLAAFKRIRPTVDFSIENYVYSYSDTPYKRWELIVDEYEELVKDLID